MNYSLFCDESRHLLKDKKDRFMVMGVVRCHTDRYEAIVDSINNIKNTNNYYPEIKWTRVSKNNLIFFLELIEYFFETQNIDFRCVVIDKSKVRLNDYNFTEDDFFYRMYYTLLKSKVRKSFSDYKIYIDEKDNFSDSRCLELQGILENKVYNFISAINLEITCIDSESSVLVQLCDFFIGAVGYCFNNYISNEAKIKTCLKISSAIGIESLNRQIKKFDKKFDIYKITLS